MEKNIENFSLVGSKKCKEVLAAYPTYRVSFGEVASLIVELESMKLIVKESVRSFNLEVGGWEHLKTKCSANTTGQQLLILR